jgi:large subunit ribosomal protein L20
MTRVKRGTTSTKTRRNVLKMVKGYRNRRSSKERSAREAIAHAGNHAFNHRRDKKGDFRRLWQIQISTFLKDQGLSYSKFMGVLKKENTGLNRKMLAQIAKEEPESFKRILEHTKQ